ncbi:hypothetical protein NC653_037410 [Populus alba x Populus x berolinensis]|uniref:Uncharacterized protein n=1 Tax=Populus alba x Populus x berolinensis TaxID=444605 RepID=A0AAD6LEG8_9ROSI|nr:hypothetical protein NC653_037410 [Populus alba x Populus x berolinensis]
MYKEDKFEGGFGVLLLILECGSDHRGFVYHKFLDVILLDCPCYSQKGGAGLKKVRFCFLGYFCQNSSKEGKPGSSLVSSNVRFDLPGEQNLEEL